MPRGIGGGVGDTGQEQLPIGSVKYDKRQFFYPQIDLLEKECINAAMTNDVERWVKALRVIKSKVVPYMEEGGAGKGPLWYRREFERLRSLIYSERFRLIHSSVMRGVTPRASESELRQYSVTFNLVVIGLEELEEALNKEMDVIGMGLPRSHSDPDEAILEQEYEG